MLKPKIHTIISGYHCIGIIEKWATSWSAEAWQEANTPLTTILPSAVRGTYAPKQSDNILFSYFQRKVMIKVMMPVDLNNDLTMISKERGHKLLLKWCSNLLL